MPPIVCAECLSPNVQLKAWIDPNTNKVFDDAGHWDASDNNYCFDCDRPVTLTRSKKQQPK